MVGCDEPEITNVIVIKRYNYAYICTIKHQKFLYMNNNIGESTSIKLMKYNVHNITANDFAIR